MAIVGESGEGKTPLLNATLEAPTKPILEIFKAEHQKARARYQNDLASYNELKPEERLVEFPEGKPKEPRKKEVFFRTLTLVGLANYCNEFQEEGTIEYVDEIAGLIQSANKYSKGKGDDVEVRLSLFKGAGFIDLRADGIKASVEQTNHSIIGGIQPAKLKQLMGNCEDIQGQYARFLFCLYPNVEKKLVKSDAPRNLIQILTGLYQKVYELPVTEYHFDDEAFEYFSNVFEDCFKQRKLESASAVRAMLAKIPEFVTKLAENMHVIYELLEGRIPSVFIPKERVAEATRLASFCSKRIQAFYIRYAGNDKIPAYISDIIKLSKEKGWITARELKQRWATYKEKDANLIRQWFEEAARLGKGKLKGKDARLQFQAYQDEQTISDQENCRSTVDAPSTAKSIAQSDLQRIVDTVDESKNFDLLSLPEEKIENLSTVSTNLQLPSNDQVGRVIAVDGASTVDLQLEEEQQPVMDEYLPGDLEQPENLEEDTKGVPENCRLTVDVSSTATPNTQSGFQPTVDTVDVVDGNENFYLHPLLEKKTENSSTVSTVPSSDHPARDVTVDGSSTVDLQLQLHLEETVDAIDKNENLDRGGVNQEGKKEFPLDRKLFPQIDEVGSEDVSITPEIDDSSTTTGSVIAPEEPTLSPVLTEFVIGDEVEHTELGQGTVTYGGQIEEMIFCKFSCGQRSPQGQELTLIRRATTPKQEINDADWF